MSKSAAPTSPLSDADEVRQQLAGKHVCPFCGVMRADPAQPCPRCTLDDTVATRTATKQRVGPWFVLQARNPSAPGMKLATLQSLVRRGHVTPRSVVRGPSTEQLWAFAAGVRGLSREFGLCHHCQQSIEPTAVQCPQCGRSQGVVGDPDALVESSASSAVTPPVSAMPTFGATPEPLMLSSHGPSDTGMDGGTSLDLQADPNPPPVRQAPARSAPVRPTPVRPPVPAAPTTLQRVPPKEESILTARELAAAFQLDFKQPGATGRPAARPVRTLAGLLLIAALATALVLGLRADWRQQAFAWVTDHWARVAASLEQPAARPPAPTKLPPTNPAVTPVTTPPTPVDVRPAPSAPEAPPAVPASVPIVPVVPPAPVVPAPVPRPAPVVERPPVVESPVVVPDNLTIDQATALAVDLRNRAIDAEARKDWAGAARLYEQIQRLPRDAWPADLPMRLELARRRAS